jgi:hypothetical protein
MITQHINFERTASGYITNIIQLVLKMVDVKLIVWTRATFPERQNLVYCQVVRWNEGKRRGISGDEREARSRKQLLGQGSLE